MFVAPVEVRLANVTGGVVCHLLLGHLDDVCLFQLLLLAPLVGQNVSCAVCCSVLPRSVALVHRTPTISLWHEAHLLCFSVVLADLIGPLEAREAAADGAAHLLERRWLGACGERIRVVSTAPSLIPSIDLQLLNTYL